jgi:hypothetical protein
LKARPVIQLGSERPERKKSSLVRIFPLSEKPTARTKIE